MEHKIGDIFSAGDMFVKAVEDEVSFGTCDRCCFLVHPSRRCANPILSCDSIENKVNVHFEEVTKQEAFEFMLMGGKL